MWMRQSSIAPRSACSLINALPLVAVGALLALWTTGCGTSLRAAVVTGNFESVRRVVDAHPQEVFRRDDRGNTVLHIAALQGNVPISEFLVAKGSDVHARNTDGETPLILAAQAGSARVCSLLLEKGSEVDALPTRSWPALFRAITSNAFDVVQVLVAAGANIGWRDSEGRTAIHIAAFWGKGKSLKLLLDKGAEINLVDRYGETPLDAAEIGDNPITVRNLLSRGATNALPEGERMRRREYNAGVRAKVGQKVWARSPSDGAMADVAPLAPPPPIPLQEAVLPIAGAEPVQSAVGNAAGAEPVQSAVGDKVAGSIMTSIGLLVRVDFANEARISKFTSGADIPLVEVNQGAKKGRRFLVAHIHWKGKEKKVDTKAGSDFVAIKEFNRLVLVSSSGKERLPTFQYVHGGYLELAYDVPASEKTFSFRDGNRRYPLPVATPASPLGTSPGADAVVSAQATVGFGEARGMFTGDRASMSVYLWPIDSPSDEWPNAQPDSSGRWVVRNLKPGRYCPLALDAPPRGAFAISDEIAAKLCKEVKAGQVTSFGR